MSESAFVCVCVCVCVCVRERERERKPVIRLDTKCAIKESKLQVNGR